MEETIQYKSAVRVTILSSASNTILAFCKIIIGYLANSHALVADGVHSFSDLITDAFVLLTAKIGNQLPDKDHPYGHKRIETLGVIVVSLILIAAAIGIAYDALQHILQHTKISKPGISALVITIVSIAVKEWLYRYSLIVGKKTNSNLIISNAWHQRIDALSSIIVLLSIVGTLMGFNYLDAIGAIVIALWILKIGITMIWEAGKELIDTAVDENILAQMVQYVLSIPGVVAIHQFRTRSHAGNVFLDLHIQVMPNISVSEGHYISEQVHFGLKKSFEQITDATIHIDPENDQTTQPSQDLPNRQAILEQLKTYWQHLPGYDLVQRTTLHYLNGKLYIELFMPCTLLKQYSSESLEKIYNDALQNNNQIGTVSIFYR